MVANGHLHDFEVECLFPDLVFINWFILHLSLAVGRRYLLASQTLLLREVDVQHSRHQARRRLIRNRAVASRIKIRPRHVYLTLTYTVPTAVRPCLWLALGKLLLLWLLEFGVWGDGLEFFLFCVSLLVHYFVQNLYNPCWVGVVFLEKGQECVYMYFWVHDFVFV